MPASPRRRTAPVLTRRAAVTAIVAGLAGASACDDHRSTRHAGSGVSGGSGASGGSAAAGGNPDVALVERVRTELADVLALATEAGTRFDSLRGPLRPFRDLHRAHLAVLDDHRSTGSAGASAAPPAPGQLSGAHSPAAALHRLVVRERLTQARLADAAVAAESGTLARLLASMSAAVGQRLAATARTTEAGTS